MSPIPGAAYFMVMEQIDMDRIIRIGGNTGSLYKKVHIYTRSNSCELTRRKLPHGTMVSFICSKIRDALIDFGFSKFVKRRNS